MRICQSVQGQKHTFPNGSAGLPRIRRYVRPCNTRSATVQGAVTLQRPGDTISALPSSPPQVRRTTLQGSDDWKDLIRDLDQDSKPEHIDEDLRRALAKYGELTQICYDSFHGDERDRSTFGHNRYQPAKLFEETARHNDAPHMRDYTATHYLYANSGGGFCLHHNHHNHSKGREGPEEHRYWMGYVAVSKKDEAGLRDVVFAWRGTIAHSEWHIDAQDKQVPYDALWNAPRKHNILPRHGPSRPYGPPRAPGVLLAQGFHKLYTFSGENSSRSSPQEQVRAAMVDIKNSELANEIGSITVCGHSLGGALATVCSFDLAVQGLNVREDGTIVPVTAYTYASPRVGNKAFVKMMEDLNVKVLRSVNVHDIVPKMPGVSRKDMRNTPMEKFGVEAFAHLKIIGNLGTTFWRLQSLFRKPYDDVGFRVGFSSRDHPDKIKPADHHPVSSGARVHNLEVLLHLIDPKRDPALMNKTEDALLDSKGIPAAFFTVPFKGLDRMPHPEDQEKKWWSRTSQPHNETDGWPEGVAKLLIPRQEHETA